MHHGHRVNWRLILTPATPIRSAREHPGPRRIFRSTILSKCFAKVKEFSAPGVQTWIDHSYLQNRPQLSRNALDFWLRPAGKIAVGTPAPSETFPFQAVVGNPRKSF